MTPSSQPDPTGPDGAEEVERMEKEAITLEDGRTLIYYRFVPEER
ncbi:MAG TPA: hypothetical protein V6D00_08610 [Pantanalinema sp.]